jgi:hypothetical protein
MMHAESGISQEPGESGIHAINVSCGMAEEKTVTRHLQGVVG